MTQMRPFAIGFLILWGVLAGCAPTVYEKPTEVLLDRKRPGRLRHEAFDQLVQNGTTVKDPAYNKALYQLVWSDRHPMDLRIRAAEILIESDEETFIETSKTLIAVVDHWPMLEYLFAKAIERNWQGFTVSAVHSWSRPSQRYGDHTRPECDLLQALNPGTSPERVAFNVFAGSYGPTTLRQQVAAWQLLCRITTQDKLKLWLSRPELQSEVARNLRLCQTWVDRMPRKREGVLMLNHLAQSNHALGGSDRVTEAMAEWPHDWFVDTEVRHIPVLVRAMSHPPMKDPRDLQRDILVRLEKQTRYARIDQRHMEAEKLEHQLDKIALADWFVMADVLRAMESSSVRSALFLQADQDLSETRTELGGVLGYDDSGQFKVMPFEPKIMDHDRKFYASDQLVEAMYTNLAHYHFHAQSHDNDTYAGPGRGDTAFASRMESHAVVFSFIDHDTLNVDYYQPNGAVIDLGCIKRP